MIRDITIGQYYEEDSFVHKLDPRIKIFAVFAYVSSLFIMDSFAGYTIALLVFLFVSKLSKIPFKFMFRGLKSVIFILSFTAVLNIFFRKGDTVLFEAGFLSITVEGILFSLKMCIRLVLLIIGSSLLTLSTTPIKMTDGIESILKPFEKIGVKSHDIAMIMTIALRFIPTLVEEVDKIMKAQQARGADFECGNIIKRAKNMMPILVPLFVNAIMHALELAAAMESRCYRGGDGRTKMYPMKYQKMDFVASLMIVLYIFLSFVVAYFGI